MSKTEPKPQIQIVDELAADLIAAVDLLPFSGGDQRGRARDIVTKMRAELTTVELLLEEA